MVGTRRGCPEGVAELVGWGTEVTYSPIMHTLMAGRLDTGGLSGLRPLPGTPRLL
jgi:hypothetical protein